MLGRQKDTDAVGSHGSQGRDTAVGVSVIIPAYNPGPRLKVALSSVLAQQADVPFEVVVVDDGGSEDLSWVDEVDPPRVRRVPQANAGVSVARNVGVTHAKYELIAFLDQDDEWRPGKLARQLIGWDERPEASFHCTGFDWALGDTLVRGGSDEPSWQSLLSNGHICLSSVLVSKAHYWSVGGHDPTLRMMQDYDLFLRLILIHGDPAFTPEPLVQYNVHDQNASRDYAAAARERFRILDDHAALATHRGQRDTLSAIRRGRERTKELYAHQAVDASRRAWKEHRTRRGLGHLAAATNLSPRVVAQALKTSARRRLPVPRR